MQDLTPLVDASVTRDEARRGARGLASPRIAPKCWSKRSRLSRFEAMPDPGFEVSARGVRSVILNCIAARCEARSRSSADAKPAAFGRRAGCRGPRWAEARLSSKSRGAERQGGMGLGAQARISSRAPTTACPWQCSARPVGVARWCRNTVRERNLHLLQKSHAHHGAGEPSPSLACQRDHVRQERPTRSGGPKRRRHGLEPGVRHGLESRGTQQLRPGCQRDPRRCQTPRVPRCAHQAHPSLITATGLRHGLRV